MPGTMYLILSGNFKSRKENNRKKRLKRTSAR